MKTHELARALAHLARILKTGLNVELKDWPGPSKSGGKSDDAEISTANTATALNILVGLSRFSKGEWRGMIEEWKLPVEVRHSDSVRDLLGRLLNYLDKHRDEAQRIQNEATSKSTTASPELSKVLSILLGGDKDDETNPAKKGGKAKGKGEQQE